MVHCKDCIYDSKFGWLCSHPESINSTFFDDNKNYECFMPKWMELSRIEREPIMLCNNDPDNLFANQYLK